MTYARMSHTVAQRRGYSHIGRNNYYTPDIVVGLLNTAITREGLQDSQKSFLKRKRNGNLQIVKVVNNRLRNTVIITYAISKLNDSKVVDVYFKRYRKNTVEKFGQPCRETIERRYDLNVMGDNIQFVRDVEDHMRVCPENLKTVTEALPIRVKGFKEIRRDSLYAFEIYAFDVVKNQEDPLNSYIDLALVSDKMERNFRIKVRDIVNYNDIESLVGMWIVVNYKDSFKIKNKEDILTNYSVID